MLIPDLLSNGSYMVTRPLASVYSSRSQIDGVHDKSRLAQFVIRANLEKHHWLNLRRMPGADAEVHRTLAHLQAMRDALSVGKKEIVIADETVNLDQVDFAAMWEAIESAKASNSVFILKLATSNVLYDDERDDDESTLQHDGMLQELPCDAVGSSLYAVVGLETALARSRRFSKKVGVISIAFSHRSKLCSSRPGSPQAPCSRHSTGHRQEPLWTGQVLKEAVVQSWDASSP